MKDSQDIRYNSNEKGSRREERMACNLGHIIISTGAGTNYLDVALMYDLMRNRTDCCTFGASCRHACGGRTSS